MAKCLEVDGCRAITLVGPNPEQYAVHEGYEGCHLKNDNHGVTVDTPFVANMVSYNMQCVISNLNCKFEL